MFKDARWADTAMTKVRATLLDDKILVMPAVMTNADYRALTQGSGEPGEVLIDIAPYQPTSDDVRAEAERRMIVLVEARDRAHMNIILSNGLRETARYQQILIDGGALDGTQQARKTMLEGADTAIEAIRAASNDLEAMDQVPGDFANESYWN